MTEGKIDFTLEKISSFINFIYSTRDEIRGKHSSYENAYNSACNYLKGNIRVFEHNLNVCEEERGVASDNKQKIENAIDNINKMKEDLGRVKEGLEDGRNRLETAVWNAQDAVEEWDKKKPEKGTGEGAEEAFKKALSAWQSTRRDLVEQHDQLRRDYDGMNDRIKEVQKKISNCAEAIGDLKGLLRKLNEVIDNLDGEYKKLSDCKRSFESALEGLRDSWENYVERYDSAVRKLEAIAQKAESAYGEAEQIAASVSELTGDRVGDGERLAFVDPDFIADSAIELMNCANKVSEQGNRAAEFTFRYNNELQDGVMEDAVAIMENVNGGFENLGLKFAKIGNSLKELSEACNNYLETAIKTN